MGEHREAMGEEAYAAKEAAIRAKFSVPSEEIIPEHVVRFVNLGPSLPLSASDMRRARAVADRYFATKPTEGT